MKRPNSRLGELAQQLFVSISLVAAILLLVAACGSSGDANDGVASLGEPTATSATSDSDNEGNEGEQDPEEAMLDYAGCMREHGIDMPDPVGSKGSGPQVKSATASENQAEGADDADSEEFEQAHQTCKEHIEGLNVAGLSLSDSDAESNARMTQWAECMREHGVDVPDPVGAEDDQGEDGQGEPPTLPDPEDPEFKKAAEECDPILEHMNEGGE